MPVLFEVFGVKVYAHHFFLVLGIVVLFAWVAYEARRRHWPASEVVPIGLGGFVGAMVGARLSILFFNGWDTAPIVLNFYSLFDPRIGPGSILGAIAGAYIGGYLVSRLIGKAGCACDAFAPGMALGMAVGRIGDFLSGEDGTALGYMAHGGHGCISVTANVAPRLCAEFQTACMKGDFESARAVQDRLMPLHDALFIEPSPAPVKYAGSLLRLCTDEVRLPLIPATENARAVVRAALASAGLKA